MENNYFQKLSEIQCVVEKKNGLNYISWSDAWAEVKKIHPEATYTIYENSEGFPFWESKFGIDVKVGVTINGIEHISRLPVMDGANNSMTDKEQKYKVFKNVYQYGKLVYENNKPKKEEVEVTIAPATTFDINKTIQRAFAKAIAMHGLGLYVYRGEDLPEDNKDNAENAPTSNATTPSSTNTLEYIKSENIDALLKNISEGVIMCASADDAIKLAKGKYKVAKWAEEEIREKGKKIFI